MRWLAATAVALAAAMSALRAAPPTPPAPADWQRALVRVDSGPVQGGVDGTSRVFRGIPYAAPPVGANRWRPPASPLAWTAPLDATRFGRACPQAFAELMVEPVGETGEDCLTLNVWSEAASPAERRPVMVWIHGGAYVQGAASQRFYDGAPLASRGVVLVSVNYRLGPLGFFAHPALSKESGRDASGNQGVADVISALGWVQRNIAAFGGDPTRVTVFGQSSGAGLVNVLLTSPRADGLFHRAILQSGSVLGPMQHLRETRYMLPPGEAIGERVQRALGIEGDASSPDVLPRLREANIDALQRASDAQKPFNVAGNRFAPIVDGELVPEEPSAALDAGRFAKVPVLAGANEDEGTAFLPLFGPTTPFTYAQLAMFAYGSRAADVLRLFPAGDDEAQAKAALGRSLGMAAFVAPARRLAAAVASRGGAAYLYHFTRVRPGPAGERLGAFHGSEVPFVFGTLAPRDLPGYGAAGVDEIDRRLSDTVMRQWVRFAETGDPNGPGLPAWPRFDTTRKATLELGTEIAVRDGVHTEASDVFDAAWKEWQGRK